MKPKVTCTILTFNEAARIRIALTHAFKWADEVLVIDKGSGDETTAIAREMGAWVYAIPFSKQGHEDIASYCHYALHDWVWGFTPGEVPTRSLIDAALGLATDEVDAIVIPNKYFSFGVHHSASPWYWSGQLRLFNRKRVKFTGIAHSPIDTKAARVATISEPSKNYVLHQTHQSAQEFMRAHADYMINEAKNGTPQAVTQRAGAMIDKYGKQMQGKPELFAQLIGWQIYWLGVALHAWERDNPSVPEQYSARAWAMLEEEWKQ